MIDPPRSVASVIKKANEANWIVYPTHNEEHDSWVVRCSKEGATPFYASWKGSRFVSAYARNAQRLSYADIATVLLDPSAITEGVEREEVA